MAVQQTECYRVVTIGYLKNFIGTEIQNSSGGVVYVNTGGRPDSYCPTYSELTNGSLIPYWSPGGTPNGDRDGITVNSSAVLGGSYAGNQLVDQRDLGLVYTRYSGLTISLGKTTFSECGDNTSVSYSHGYTRYKKSMNDSCSVGTTTSGVYDTACGELYWHPTLGSVSNCNTYSIEKNGSVSASSRSISVYAHIVFRGSQKNSNTVSMTQNALTGSYSTYVTNYNVITGCSARATTTQSFGCGGGIYGAAGTGYYDTYYRYSWTDSCGENYPSLTRDTKVSSNSTDLGSKSGGFSSYDCCNGSHSDSATLSFSYGSYSDSVSFSQLCVDCSSSPSCNPCQSVSYTIDDSGQITCNGGMVNFCIDGKCAGGSGGDTKGISTIVRKGGSSTTSNGIENITLVAGGNTYTVVNASLNYDTSAEAVYYPNDMLGKAITSVSVLTDNGENKNATINPTTLTTSTSTVTITLQ